MSAVFYLGHSTISARWRHRSARKYVPLPFGKSAEDVTPVATIGPLDIEYLDPPDEPPEQSRHGRFRQRTKSEGHRNEQLGPGYRKAKSSSSSKR
jgi:hypothetical protein